jgi:hypothetical protein
MLRILRRSEWYACLISLIVFLILSFGRWPALGWSAQLNLVVEAELGGQRFYCLPVSPGEIFQIEFLHSYDRFPFKELYRVEGPEEIRLFRMVFRSMLNGQGFVHPGARVRTDGWGEIDNIASSDETVEFIMGGREDANHRLTLRGVEYMLSDTIEQGTLVVIRVQEAPCSGSVSMKKGDFDNVR